MWIISFLNEKELICLHSSVVIVSTQWNRFNYCYSTLIILFKLIICLYIVKWFQVLRCITNNSFKHQSFVYTQLNDQTVLLQTIQFCKNHLFGHSLNFKQFYLIHRSDATTSDQSGPGSNGNEGVLYIPQSSSIA